MRAAQTLANARFSARIPSVLLVALGLLSGCSLIIDSSEYVAETDAGVVDSGAVDMGALDTGPADGGDVDQGSVTCGTAVCSGNTPHCVALNFCGECLQNSHCANSVCDTLTGSCIDPIPDCTTCAGANDVCVDHPGGSGKACIRCDRDSDGFTANWNLCDGVAPAGRPRDCNDGDAQQFPGISPICADGALQGCPAPEFDGLIQHLGADVVEFGRTQVYVVANGIGRDAQLSTVARRGDYLSLPGDQANAARWVFGYIDGGEAYLSAVQERGFNPVSGQFGWNVAGGMMRGTSGWPFDANEVTAFTLDAPGDSFRFGGAGKVGGAPSTVLMAQNISNGVDILASAAETAGFMPPLALIGPETQSDLVFRQGSTNSRMLHAQRSGQTQTAPLLPDAQDYVLDAEGDHVFFNTNSGAVAYWDGTATLGRNVDGTVIGASAVGPARFSSDGAGRTIGLVPYLNGVRVVFLNCTGGGLDNCDTVSTVIQPLLQNMTTFDFEVHDGVLYVAYAAGDSVFLHVLSMSMNGTLTQRTSNPLRIIGPMDLSPAVQSMIAVETDIHRGPNHFEIVVGAVGSTNSGATAGILGTGLRACTSL